MSEISTRDNQRNPPLNSDSTSLVDYWFLVPKKSSFRSKEFITKRGEKYYILELPNRKYLRINANVKIILDLIDGSANIQEIAKKTSLKLHLDVTCEFVLEFIKEKMVSPGLVFLNDFEQYPSLHQKAYKSPFMFFVSVLSPRAIKIIGTPFTIFFYRPILLTSIIFIIFTSLRYLDFIEKNASLLKSDGSLVYVTTFLYISSILFHELGHISACLRYNIVPPRAGFGAVFFVPVFFVDTTESWLLDRNPRIMIDVGGIYFQGFFLALLMTGNLMWKSLLIHLIIQLSFFVLIMNFLPFVRMDGYWLFSDLLGIPNLYTTSLNYLRSLGGRISDYDGPKLTPIQYLIVPYAILNTLLISFFLYYAIQFVVNAIHFPQTLLDSILEIVYLLLRGNLSQGFINLYLFIPSLIQLYLVALLSHYFLLRVKNMIYDFFNKDKNLI